MKKTLLTTTILVSILHSATPGLAGELISNLEELWTDPGIGSIRSPGQGAGFGVGFATGAGWFSVDSVTLEQFLFDPSTEAGRHVLLYQVQLASGAASASMTLLGELGNPTVDPAETQWPGQTTFVVYSPLAPIVLQPASQYMVAMVTDVDAPAPPDLLFTLKDSFTGLPGWQLGQDYFGLVTGGSVTWVPAFEPGHLKFRVLGSVPPNQPPDVSRAYPSVAKIWPPDGKFVPFHILGVSDPDGDAIEISINAIEQDEPVVAPGCDRTAPDAIVDGSDTAAVRAERLGSGNGRVYRVSFTATDGKPNGTVEGMVFIQVPHDKGGRAAAIDDGPMTGYYDSTILK